MVMGVLYLGIVDGLKIERSMVVSVSFVAFLLMVIITPFVIERFRYGESLFGALTGVIRLLIVSSFQVLVLIIITREKWLLGGFLVIIFLIVRIKKHFG
jgi:hypothetical protein